MRPMKKLFFVLLLLLGGFFVCHLYAREDKKKNESFLPKVENLNSTRYKRLPKSGIYVYGTNGGTFIPGFYRKAKDGSFYPATDYAYHTHSKYYHRATFFPYKKGVYYSLTKGRNTQAKDVHIAYGHVMEKGGRLPNLFPMAAYQSYDNDNKIERINFANASKEQMKTYGKFYGSILRVEDVDKIVAAPPYTIFCRVYRIDDEKKQIVFVEDRFAATDHVSANTGIAGCSELDFSGYKFKGYILLGINHHVSESSRGRITFPFMGMMNLFSDTQRSIFVKWKKGVKVTYDSDIPSVIKDNIRLVTENPFAPDMMASAEDGGYSNWARKYVIPIPTMGKVNGWWYNGGNECNAPYMHVNPKSFITASKNRHSRVYVTRGQHNPKVLNNLYGTVCSSTVGLILGLPVGIETMEYVSRFPKDFEYRSYNSFEDLHAGDIYGQLTMKKWNYGHVVYIAEKVSINGKVFCLNTFEGYAPWIGWNSYINHTGHLDYEVVNPAHNNLNILSFRSSKWFGSNPYKIIARPTDKVYKPIQNVNDMYDTQDYPVTEIMCDRGTDAVYCIGEYLGLTVTDGTTAIDVHKDGNSYSTLDLNNYPWQTFDDGKVYDIYKAISEPGYYELYVSGTKKESFFVPKNREINIVEKGNDFIIRFDPDEDKDVVKAITIYYCNPTYDGTFRRPVHFVNDIDAHQTINGKCQFKAPNTTTWVDSVARYAYHAIVTRKTPYGTYWTRTDGSRSTIPGDIPGKPYYRQLAGRDRDR